MYTVHPSLGDVGPDSAKIWRYMDLSKLVSILENRALFFPKLRHILHMDPFEGSFPRANYTQRQAVAAATVAMLPPDVPHEFRNQVQALNEDPAFLDQGADRAREYFFVSCWHMSEYESAAMWRLYVQGGEGIAIQSTIGGLKESFPASPGQEYIGRVQYMDDPVLPPGFLFPLALWKRPSYEHEKELRALIFHNKPEEIYQHVTSVGIYVPSDLDILVERLYVAPTTALWFKEAVGSVMYKYEMGREVQQSDLDTPPASSAILSADEGQSISLR